MAFCSGAGIKPRRCRRSGPEVGVVGEGNQGIVGDESGDAVELACFRDVEDLLAERGIMVSYETVRRRHMISAVKPDEPTSNFQ